MGLELRILQAEHGDSIVISGEFDGEYRNILIDGGPAQAFEVQHIPRSLKLFLNDIKAKAQKIDLLVLTHVDDDHIGGLLAGFNKHGYLTELTQEVWFNSGKLIFNHFDKPINDSNFVMLKNNAGNNTSIAQGIRLENHLIDKGIWSHSLIQAGNKFERFGCKFKILSPSIPKLKKLLVKWEREKVNSNTSAGKTDHHESLKQLLKEDTFRADSSIHNGSSLAFIFEYQQNSVLLLGDAHASVVVASLKVLGYSKTNRLRVDYIKVSHHGSQANTNNELLTLVDCNNFIISANGNHHGLPNKRTLARIIDHFPNANLMFNYPNLIKKIFNQEELNNASFSAIGCLEVITL